MGKYETWGKHHSHVLDECALLDLAFVGYRRTIISGVVESLEP